MKVKMSKGLVIGGVALLAVIVGGFIFAGKNGQSTVVVHPRVGAVEAKVKETGYLVSQGSYVWYSPVVTTVLEVVKKPGDGVNKGDLIARLDDRALQERLKRLKAERESLVVQMRGEAAIAQADIALERVRQAELELKDLEEQYNREKALADAGAVPPVQANSLEYQVKGAQSRLVLAQANWRQVVALMKQDQYGQRLAALDEEEKGLENDIRNMEVRAPFDGVLVAGVSLKGSRVDGNTPVVRIAGPRSFEVRVDVFHEEAWKITVGQEAELFHRGTYTTAKAKVVRVGAQAEAKVSPLGLEQRRVEVVLMVDNPPPQWKEGYPLEVQFPWKSGDGFLIPKSSMVSTVDGAFVYAVENGKAHRIPVVIGAAGDTDVMILKGLTPESMIVVNSSGIQEGMEIK